MKAMIFFKKTILCVLTCGLLACQEKPVVTSGNNAPKETAKASEFVEIFAKYNENEKLVISSGNRSYETDIEKSLLRALVLKIIPYLDKNLLYIRRSKSVSLYIINPSESDPLLTVIDEEICSPRDLGGSDELGNPTGICYGDWMFVGVTAQNELEFIFGAALDETETSPDPAYPEPPGLYTMRLFFKLKDGKLHCVRKLVLGEDFGNYEHKTFPDLPLYEQTQY